MARLQPEAERHPRIVAQQQAGGEGVWGRVQVAVARRGGSVRDQAVVQTAERAEHARKHVQLDTTVARHLHAAMRSAEPEVDGAGAGLEHRLPSVRASRVVPPRVVVDGESQHRMQANGLRKRASLARGRG